MESGQEAHQTPLAEAINRLLAEGWKPSQTRPIVADRKRDLDACETASEAYTTLHWELRQRWGGPAGEPRSEGAAAPAREPTQSAKRPPRKPWRWFQKAGIPIDWFTGPEQEILRMVYQVHSLREGWTSADRSKDTRPGLDLPPSKLAKAFGYSPDYCREARRTLARCGFLRVLDGIPGRAPLVVSGWWHGPDAEAENLAALRDCFARLRRLRPRRPVPRFRRNEGMRNAHLRRNKHGVSTRVSTGLARGQYQGEPRTKNGATDRETNNLALQKSAQSPGSTESRDISPEKPEDSAIDWQELRELVRRRVAPRIAKERKRRKGNA